MGDKMQVKEKAGGGCCFMRNISLGWGMQGALQRIMHGMGCFEIPMEAKPAASVTVRTQNTGT